MNRQNQITEAKNSHFRKVNKQLLIGWGIIVVILLAAYAVEAIKAARMPEIEHLKDWRYYSIFAPIVTLPFIGGLIIFLKRPNWDKLCYYVVPGYLMMYIFIMFTTVSSSVFTYILPMLSLLILYHNPKLILGTGIASLIVNVISIFVFNADIVFADGGKGMEIQLALIILCFGGCLAASKLYDDLTKNNYDYIAKVHEQNDRIQAMSLQTLTTMANMIDAKDSYTEGHSRRVSVYAVQIAQALGFSDEEIENIRKIALLHDIGKIGVPDEILNKPGRLTDEEFDIMKGHSNIGGDIIKNIKTVPGLHDSVLYHHERFDGKGYPAGLKGEDIPYIARIIAVADAFDAMTSDRVYRTRLSNEQVLNELEKGSGSQFDPDISQTMLHLIHEGTIKTNTDLPA